MEKNQKSGDKLLREFLAEERTILAKERTRQSSIRTGIALMAMGIATLKLFEGELWAVTLSTVFISLGLAVVLRNLWWEREYEKKRNTVEREIHKLEPEKDMITDYDILSNHKGRLIP